MASYIVIFVESTSAGKTQLRKTQLHGGLYRVAYNYTWLLSCERIFHRICFQFVSMQYHSIKSM